MTANVAEVLVKGCLLIKAGVEPLIAAGKSLSDSNQIQGAIVAILSVALIFVALFLLVKVMRSAMQTRVEVYITRFLGHSAMLSLLVGMVMTVMVQSSSITTSLLVPLAGAGLITLEQAFPITLGANIGTTVTALLASMAVSGGNASMGVAIALVHLLFNLTGTVMVYPLKATRRIPLILARRFAEFAVRSRKWAILYILIMFYALPAAFAFLSRWLP
jgi:sodium-dependent phosphate cotransporter